jgi:hypothetical protein
MSETFVRWWSAVLCAVAVAAIVLFTKAQPKRRAKKHWFRAFAAEHEGTWHGVFSGLTATPSFGVHHPSGTPLGDQARHMWVEFQRRGHSVLAADGKRTDGDKRDSTALVDERYVQVKVPPSPQLVIGKAEKTGRVSRGLTWHKTGDQAFDTAYRTYTDDPQAVQEVLDRDLRAWLLRNLGDRPVKIQHGSLRTWHDSGLDSERALFADADFVIRVADRLPARLWRTA